MFPSRWEFFEMDFRKRDRVVEWCNWLMVGVAAGWVIYTFGSSFSPTADAQRDILQTVSAPSAPLDAATAPVPVWGSGDNAANPPDSAPDRISRPSRASATSRSDRPTQTPSTPQERDPTSVWGDAPYVVAPEVPIPPLSTLPPGVGPEF